MSRRRRACRGTCRPSLPAGRGRNRHAAPVVVNAELVVKLIPVRHDAEAIIPAITVRREALG
jgi:hypothetical protein